MIPRTPPRAREKPQPQRLGYDDLPAKGSLPEGLRERHTRNFFAKGSEVWRERLATLAPARAR